MFLTGNSDESKYKHLSLCSLVTRSSNGEFFIDKKFFLGNISILAVKFLNYLENSIQLACNLFYEENRIRSMRGRVMELCLDKLSQDKLRFQPNSNFFRAENLSFLFLFSFSEASH